MSAATSRPHIVFILTDDQAPTAAGFAGNTELQTPHLDRIAREGMTLTNSFVVTPVCSPSRASLVTSRFGSELGIIDWINPNSEPEHGLDPKTVTWPELLHDAGYRTGLFGKWHLGTQDRFHPTRVGYESFVGIRDGGCPSRGATVEVAGKPVKQEGYTADVFTDHALQFIQERDDRPFLCSLHFREPHSPWLPMREEDWEPYSELDPTLPDPDFPNLQVDKVKRMTREYYGSVASIDRNVGRVLALLDELGIAENTLVIFTSDHGYHNGHHGLWFKGNAQWMTNPSPPQEWRDIGPRQRPNLYDQALRVPTAVRWPRIIAPGGVLTRTVTNLDWYPTLLAAADVPLPDGVKIHGHSLLPLLQGAEVEWDDSFYCEYSMRHGATVDMRALRTPEWKLMIDFHHPGRAELYDLGNDPGETTNLIGSVRSDAQAAREDLEARLRARMKSIGDFAGKTPE
ncbi:MAG: sulfatase-like hydrolase/transferase [Planctomycetaceae bacterium]